MQSGQSNILGTFAQRLFGVRGGGGVIDESDRRSRHLILGESARLVRAKDLDTPKHLHRGQALREHVCDLHPACDHQEGQRDADGHAFGDESNDAAHDVVEHRHDVHVGLVVFAQPACPCEQDQKRQEHSQATDDAHKASDLPLDGGGLLLHVGGSHRNAAHNRPVPGEKHNTGCISIGAQRSHQSDVLALEEVLICHLHGAADLLGLSRHCRSVESKVVRCLQQTDVCWDFVTGPDAHDVTGSNVACADRLERSIA